MAKLQERIGPPRTAVRAILRRAPRGPSEDPRRCPVVWDRELGKNIITRRGSHIMAAKLAGGVQAGAPAALPGANSYAETNAWYLKYMSLGSGSTAADTADLTLQTELAGSLHLLQQAQGDDTGNVFTGLSDDALAYYTHITWSALYGAGEGNGTIRELGLWIADGTSNPSGDVVGPAPARGPLVSRKVLSGNIEKTADFTLEFLWTYIYS